MEEFSELKSARLLSIYARLLNGRVLKKALLAQEFGVTARSIQRDLESLRSFLSNEMLPQDVVYDRAAGGYRPTHARPVGLSNSEILAVCKILLESRSMRRDEMLPILDKLVDYCIPEENKRAVQQMIGNEKLHYMLRKNAWHFVRRFFCTHSKDPEDTRIDWGQQQRRTRYRQFRS